MRDDVKYFQPEVVRGDKKYGTFVEIGRKGLEKV
jgi:hypothetical protein